MPNSTVRSLLHHAAAAIRMGSLALALQLIKNADSIAEGDTAINDYRRGQIRTARLALAIHLAK